MMYRIDCEDQRSKKEHICPKHMCHFTRVFEGQEVPGGRVTRTNVVREWNLVKDHVDRSRGIEILIVEVLGKIKPTYPNQVKKIIIQATRGVHY
jgi:hypothetical protein